MFKSSYAAFYWTIILIYPPHTIPIGHVSSVVAQQYDDKSENFLGAQTVKTVWSVTDSGSELFDEVNPLLDEYTKAEHGNEQFSLVWRNISVNLKSKGTNLIDNVSGVAQSGRVLAIMGASGAGKTTLLNALGYRAPYATVTGQITFGRRQFTSEDLYFVPQFDEVNRNFTVYEQIELVGLLKCIDVEKMHARLTKLLVILGLQKKAKCLCNALTGGELKRVSVGMGMISNPSVLFLDEPTTGLDSTAAYSVVKHLVELAETVNVAVVITIHQPTEMASAILQDLYLLENGRLAYAGPRSCADRYFSNVGYQCPENTGIADFLLDMVTKSQDEANKNWEYQFLTSNFGKNVAKQIEILDRASCVAPSASESPSFLSRLYTLIVFNLKYYSRDRGFYYLRLLFLILVAFFIGTVFLQLVQESQYIPRYAGVVFYSLWTVLFSTITSTGLLVRDCRQAVEQVKNAAATPAAHCLAQLIASLPFNLLGAVVFQSIVHWLTNLHPNGEAFLYAICVTWGHLLLMEAILNTIVQVIGNAMLCVTCAIFEMGFLFLFSGFFIKIGDMPAWIRWITYITPTKYSFDGYLYVIFHGQSFLLDGPNPNPFDTSPVIIPGDRILLELYGSDGIKPWPMFGTLLAWVALIRMCHYGIFMIQLMPFLFSRKRGAVAGPSLEKVVGIEGRIETD